MSLVRRKLTWRIPNVVAGPEKAAKSSKRRQEQSEPSDAQDKPVKKAKREKSAKHVSETKRSEPKEQPDDRPATTADPVSASNKRFDAQQPVKKKKKEKKSTQSKAGFDEPRIGACSKNDTPAEASEPERALAEKEQGATAEPTEATEQSRVKPSLLPSD